MITVDNITFSYPGTKRNVFEDFSLKFEETAYTVCSARTAWERAQCSI